MSNQVTLVSGQEIDLGVPDFTGVSLETIGLMLYRQLRYNGATARAYCVLEHTVRGARACLDPEQSPGLGAYGRTVAKHFLMHDAHEIVTGDISSPVIREIGKDRVDRLKHRLDLAIYDRFAVEPMTDMIREMVIAVDQAMFQREWIDLMPVTFDRAAPGGHDTGPSRDFMLLHGIYPTVIDNHYRRPGYDLVGEFCHLWREVNR